MISYYVYGRKGGFINYNPNYSKEDEDHYFLKMTPYSTDGLLQDMHAGNSVQELPQKRFFYQVRSKENGDCTIFGQSSFVKANTTRISGDRDTVFSFQYLYNDRERKELISSPDTLYQYLPFPENMDQVHQPGNEEQELTVGNAVLDIDAWLKSDLRESETDRYSTQELLNAFSLTGEKLTEFLFTLLQFNTQEKVYLMLPDNTKASSDMAFALMTRVLVLLPPALVKRTGFVTCVNRVESQMADYVPFEIRYLFLTNTEENRTVCRRTRSAFVFLDGCNTGVRIPADLREIAEHLTNSFLNGKADRELTDLWNALDSWLREDVAAPVSPLEYHTLYRFCLLCRMATEADSPEQYPAEKEIWENIDTLRKMEKERGQLWQQRMNADVTGFVKTLIDGDVIEGADGYRRLFAEYEAYPELQANIENFFYRKIKDYAELEEYIKMLEPCPGLKQKVSDHFVDMLLTLLQSGDLEESLYATVLDMYSGTPVLQNDTRAFFEQKITDVNSYEKYRLLIIGSADKNKENLTLWNQIEKNVYADPEKYEVIAELEGRTLGRIFAGQRSAADVMKSFWNSVERLQRLNDAVLSDRRYFRIAQDGLEKLLTVWNEPETVYQIISEADVKIGDLYLPMDYQDLFTGISGKYLMKNRQKLCKEGGSPELFQSWPLVSKSNPDLISIKNSLLNKQRNEENISGFEHAISKGSAAGLVKFFRDETNREMISLAADSGNGKEYITSITRKLETEVKAPGKTNPAKNRYDDLCVCLVTAFPDCAKQIYDYVMRSEYGGVSALSSIYKKLNRSDAWDSGIQSGETQVMADAIYDYFSKSKMSRYDKRSIKEETDFLGRIGIDAKSLLKSK
ncbi:MAG: hypothetical protein LUH07_04875 [Lachnospiraceae bacterium]|nr:hypothetical protein [Lachnospiraceae bacterium]